MPSFANIQSDLEGVFAGSTWTANNITTVPQNYQGENSSTEWVRVNIIPGQSFNTYGSDGNSGMVRVDIYVPSGLGITRAFAIGDLLDTALSSQVFTNGTQTFAGNTVPVGLDPENPGLFRASYSVPYRHFS